MELPLTTTGRFSTIIEAPTDPVKADSARHDCEEIEGNTD